MKEIQIWHPINCKWIHIQQITKDDTREYYTDGKLIATIEINEDGTIKSLSELTNERPV